MTTIQSESLKYPIGKFHWPESVTHEQAQNWIEEIERLPAKLRELVEGLSDDQLDTPYRPGGWTVRQVIHHIPDSHVNGYIRFKWTLTENKPVIKAYNEQEWAKLFDSQTAPIAHSLDFLEILHIKWVYLLRGLTKDQLERTFIHPETNKEVPLSIIIGLYTWHGEHHYMHVRCLLEREGWL